MTIEPSFQVQWKAFFEAPCGSRRSRFQDGYSQLRCLRKWPKGPRLWAFPAATGGISPAPRHVGEIEAKARPDVAWLAPAYRLASGTLPAKRFLPASIRQRPKHVHPNRV